MREVRCGLGLKVVGGGMARSERGVWVWEGQEEREGARPLPTFTCFLYFYRLLPISIFQC